MFGRRSLIFIAVSVIATAHLWSAAAQKGEDVFAALQAKIAASEGITAEFASLNMPSMKGTLTVGKNNTFRIQTPDRTIACDGKLVRNYSPSDRKVIVSEYIETDDVLSPERLFLNFPAQYVPSLRTMSSSGTAGSLLSLQLKPASPDDVIGTLERITLLLEPGSLIIKEISFFDGIEEQSWSIARFKYEKNLSKNLFSLKDLPADVRTIDLR